jgi:hypothetical protein
MRGKRSIVLFLLVVLVAIALFLYFSYFRDASAPASSQSPAGQSAREAAEALPIPDVALEIATERELSSYRGTPLIFTVRLANQRAANIETENRVRLDSIPLIQEKASKGELSAEKAKRMLERANQRRPIPTVKLGSEQQSWENFIHFEYRKGSGSLMRADWDLKAIAAPESKSAKLDAQATVEVTYALNPEAASRLDEGDLEIIAVLEVPSGGELPRENWRGRVASDPVKVKVLPLPANPTPQERASQNLQAADYYAVLKDWPNTLASAEKSIAADPNLIRAHMRIGDAKEAQGDLRGARQAFGTAKRLFDAQYPKTYDDPLFLIQKIADLEARLRNR